MIRKKIIILMSILLTLIGFCLWIYWDNQAIQTTTYTVNSSKISRNMSGFTIVHVSDLHNKEFGAHQRHLISEIQDNKPDIIAITGDLIDSKHTNIDIAMDFVEKAVMIAPVYYVTGNHEAWAKEYEELHQRLINASVYLMDGQVKEFFYNGEIMYVLGCADPAFNERTVYAGDGEVVGKEIGSLSYEQDAYAILLSHRPELFQTYVSTGVDLVLTGHAHGGQFRIPFIGGLIAPNQGLFPKYTSGLVQDKGTKMVISRGLGNSILPVRINNRPELVVVKLLSEG